MTFEDERQSEVIDMKTGNRVDPLPVRGRLTTAMRNRIIELFAQFQTVSVIRSAIKTEFGRTLADATISHYDPTRASSKLSVEQRAQFDALRASYVDSAKDVAIAHQAHRLRKYEEIYDKALKGRDYSAALKAMELAAKELGGVMTNQSTVKHEGNVTHRHLSPADAKVELGMRLQAMLEQQAALPSPMPQPIENAEYSEVSDSPSP